MPTSPTFAKLDRISFDATQIGVPELLTFGRYHHNDAQAGLVPHTHERAMEICFLARGKQIYAVEGREYSLSGGDFFVTFPDETHSTKGHPQGKGRLYWLIVHMPGEGQPFLGNNLAESWAFQERLLTLPVRHFHDTGGAEDHLNALMQACLLPLPLSTPNPLRRIRIANHLSLFLLHLIESARAVSTKQPSATTARALAYIAEHITEPMTVEDMAAAAFLSESRFKTIFKQEIGIPPAEYVLRAKIEQAEVWLRDPKRTITNIAHDLNFSSSQHFATVFKRFTRKTPTAWRREGGE